MRLKNKYEITEFKFSDQDEAKNYFRDNNLYDKINQAMEYLFDKLPINTLTKDNKFDFSDLKYNEGKNYNWFWLVNDNSKILVREYRQHLTIFVNTKGENYDDKLGNQFDYYSKTVGFMLEQKPNKHKNSDVLYDQQFKGLSKVLPNLINIIENGQAHGLWNPRTLERPKWLKLTLIFTGKERVDSVDKLMFACDELFSTYRHRWAETDCIDILKTKKVGDRFGDVYEITNVNTEFPKQYSEPYYHAIGVEVIDVRHDIDDRKPKFHDVYSIINWYYDNLMYDDSKKIKRAWNFILENHDEVFSSIKYEDYMWMRIGVEYCNAMHEKYVETYGEFDKIYFTKAMEKYEWKTFLTNCWRFVQLNKEAKL